MGIGKVAITTTRIQRLSGEPTYDDELECFVWKIMFFDETSISSGNLEKMPFEALQTYLVGTTEEEAKDCVEKFKENLEEVKIHDGIMVAVVIEDGEVRAIAPMRKDCWIDLKNRFSKRSFEELEIHISSLEVY